VSPVSLLDDFSPHARVLTAVAPFMVAMLLRLMLGRNQFTRLALSLATTWFAINVLLAPYSVGMRQDIINLQNIFR